MKCYSVLAGMVLGLVGCAGYPVLPSARAADVVEVATVGNPNPIAWPGLIAEHAGMFAAEALEVKQLYVASSAQLAQQLTAGSLTSGVRPHSSIRSVPAIRVHRSPCSGSKARRHRLR